MSENKVCIADQIGSYVKYVFDTLRSYDPERKEKQLSKAMEFYKSLRGDLIINGQNPRGVAAGIAYIGAKIANMELDKESYSAHTRPTMIDISDILNISEVTTRKYAHLLREHFKI